MRQNIKENEVVLILGAGSSGVAAARLLLAQRLGIRVILLDTAPDAATRLDVVSCIAAEEAEGADGCVEIICGDAAENFAGEAALAVLSPGIDPHAPLVKNVKKQRIPVIGELELAYLYCECPVVAVTGTNGKTTTTGLIASMFTNAGLKCLAGGNLGPPFSSFVSKSAELDVAVVEVSSFQLEGIQTFRPDISVWLNFAPDHLDRYETLGDYFAAKMRIFENQTQDDSAVVNDGSDLQAGSGLAKKITFSAFRAEGDLSLDQAARICYRGEPVLELKETQLRGVHNAENLMAAIAVGIAWGLEMNQILPGLCQYQPLSHRHQVVRDLRGVLYINDSKATNPASVEMALRSCSSPVVLIAGGKNKGFDFTSLKDLVKEQVKHLVLIGEMAETIAATWNEIPGVRAINMADAVQKAQNLATHGDIVLLSPGTSSFDMFQNYADRGNQFITEVLKLT